MRNNNIMVVIGFILLVSMACNLTAGREATPDSDGDPVVVTKTPDEQVPDETSEPEQTSTEQLPTNAPTPTLPAGWLVDNSDSLRLTFNRPDGWEIVPFDLNRFELRQEEGFAWIEVNVITSETAVNWGLTYQDGRSAKQIIDEIVSASREDGTYEDPHHIVTLDGRTAWTTTGVNDLLEEPVFIGVIGYPDRALFITGHDSGIEDEWKLLLPIYEAFFASITPYE